MGPVLAGRASSGVHNLGLRSVQEREPMMNLPIIHRWGIGSTNERAEA